MFIVVCPNTVVSKLVYDWIAGEEVERTARWSPTSRAISRCSPTSSMASRSRARRTILIDSAQLESGDGIEGQTSRMRPARDRVPSKQNTTAATPGADVEKIDDEELLREVMNTVGKKGKLGEQVRLRRQRLDAHRGVGRQHRHAHPRRTRVSVASFSASRSSAAASAADTTQSTRRATLSRSTRTSTASRSSSSPPTSPVKDPLPARPVSKWPPSRAARICGSSSRS